MFHTNPFIESLDRLDPDQPILIQGRHVITTGELLASSRGLATGLVRQGVQKGQHVVLAIPPGIEFVQVVFANMMIRTVMALIDPEMGRENYLAKWKQLQPKHAFVDSRLVLLKEHPLIRQVLLNVKKNVHFLPRMGQCHLFTTGLRLPLLQDHIRIRPLLATRQEETDLVPGSPENDLMIIYTSGTVAQPKGVVHTYGSLAASLGLLTGLLHTHGARAIATHLPAFVLLGVCAGVPVHVWDPDMSARKKLDFIARHSITTLFGPPSDYLPLVRHLQDSGQSFPPCLTHICLGSAPVYPSFLKQLLACAEGVEVTCLYGMTENLLVARVDGREKVSAAIEGDLVGTPFPGVSLEMAPDGEIKVTSDQLYSRYFAQGSRQGTHSTGDLGRLDHQGRLILQGRKKDMIIRRNFNLYPGLYEPTINRIEGVVESAMIGVYNKEKEDEEVILVVENEYPIDVNTLARSLHTGPYSIDREAMPDRILFRELPRSGRQHKVDRQALSEWIKQDMP